MGSLRFEGVRLAVYSQDHAPAHVHAQYAEVEVIVDLLPDRRARLSRRVDAVIPANGSRSDVQHVVKIVARYYDELASLWEKTHG